MFVVSSSLEIEKIACVQRLYCWLNTLTWQKRQNNGKVALLMLYSYSTFFLGKQMVCGCCANIGRPILAFNKWSGLQKLVNFNVAQRNLVSRRDGNYVSIYVWTIDEPIHMEWLISSGVDGIITNNPKALAEQIVRKRRKKSLS